MSEKIKIGLSRARLFSAENCVCFCGEKKDCFNADTLIKALKALTLKEPIITAAAVLEESGKAFIVTEQNIPMVEELTGNTEDIISDKRKKGLDFSKELFHFSLINGDTLAIFSHTVVSDVKSLFILAGELLGFYDSKVFSIEPAAINIFSDVNDLPVAVKSTLTDKITSEIDEKWLPKEKNFTYDDYLKSALPDRGVGCYNIKLGFSKEETEAIIKRCAELSADVTTAAAFAFFKVFSNRFKTTKKQRGMSVSVDERLYLNKPENYRVGPFNGIFRIIKPKAKEVAKVGEFPAFHAEYYRKFTSAYNSFYNDYFLMCISPSLCDASHLYAAGVLKNKTAKKVAENYGCMNKRLIAFGAYNLDQKYWSDLSAFTNIEAFEPFWGRNSFLATVIIKDEKLTLFLDCRENECDENIAAELLRAVKDTILSI